MRRFLPLLLIGLGTALAASFGARLGPEQLAWRLDLADGASTLEPLAPAARWADWTEVGLWGWLVGVALVVVGAWLARRQKALDTIESDAAAAGGLAVPDVIARLRSEIGHLQPQIDGMEDPVVAQAAREALDRLSIELVAPVLDVRERYVARHGLVVFASWFGPFSEAERKLARCWSAITDQHAGAAREALVEADAALVEALSAWNRAETGRTTEAA